tara:strand:- start:1056 stop:4442 length:3387 start_codon:yes stop_codon:yes gene_type:complete
MGGLNSSVYSERLRGTFNSTNERTWIVQIYDRQYAGAGVGTFEITDGGLQIQFDSDGDEKFSPIVGSKCTLNMMLDFTNNDVKSFFNDIMGFAAIEYIEGDIMITIREGTAHNGDLIFWGEYLQDLDTLPDIDPPYPIQLTFTDGIGKLKEIEFKSENVDSSLDEYNVMGHREFPYWIGQIIQHTNFYVTPANPNAFWSNATNSPAFRTCVRWYNAYMYFAPDSTSGSGDPLQQTRGTVKWADTYSPSTQQRNIASAYKVLEEICRSWGMRLISWMGQWHFYQVFEMDAVNTQTGTDANKWQNPVDTPSYTYYADGDPFAREVTMGPSPFGRFNNTFHNITSPGNKIQKLSGGKYKFVPPLKEVKVNLVHGGFQNVSPGVPYPETNGTNKRLIIGGSYLNSTQVKFKTNLWLNLTPPFNSVAQSVLSGGYIIEFMKLRIFAFPAGNSTMSNCLATLSYNAYSNAYVWDTSATYSGNDLGPFIAAYSTGGPYPYGETSTIPLAPNLEWPGFRDEATDYYIDIGEDNSGAIPDVIILSSMNQISLKTGWPYGSQLQGWGWADPVDNLTPFPPSWSGALFNNLISTIQPTTTNSATTNTIFLNDQPSNSFKLDWGDVYYGDGPEVFYDSAILIRTGALSWGYANPYSADWNRCGPTDSLPLPNSSYNFTELLCVQIKQAQNKTLRRANFNSANSPNTLSQYGLPFFVNPIGVLKDIATDANGYDLNLRYLFRRGTFDMTTNQWSGEWIETTVGPLAIGSNNQKIGGGTNLIGTGNTPAAFMQQMASQNSSTPNFQLAMAAEGVTGGVAITTLDITSGYGTDVQASSFLPIGSAYNLKTGDKLYMVFPNSATYELTLTADVDGDSSRINFTSITPDSDSNGVPSLQIPVRQLFENMNRKTSGLIGGFEVASDSISKDGVTINGLIDSDTMVGASSTTLSSSESIKAYVDASGGGSSGLTNYSNMTTSTTSLSSDSNGEAHAVVIAFDNETASSVNTITLFDAAGVTGISDSAYCINFGGDPAGGYFEIIWNITTDSSVVINRVLAGVKLQQGQESGGAMVWTDISGTHGYIYNRGSGNLREGSTSGSTIIRLNHTGKLYHRLVLWKEASTNGSSKAITVTDGCQISIKQLNS